jgi:hypothetical protein
MQAWLHRNEQYLATAIRWLRQKLEQQASLEACDDSASPPGDILNPDDANGFVPALVVLRERFGLSPFEQQVLLLCAALELDTHVADLCSKAQPPPQRPYPTFALALRLFEQPDWSVLTCASPLRHWHLVEVHENTTTPLTVSPLRSDMRVVNYLKGINHLDDRLSALLTALPIASTIRLPPSQQRMVDGMLLHLQRMEQTSCDEQVFQLLATDANTPRQLAQATAGLRGLQLYRLPLEQLPSHAGEITNVARLWQRETRLLPVALYIDGTDIDPGSPQATALRHFLSRSHGLCFLGVSGKGISLERPTVTVEVAKPTPLEQRHLWESHLGPTDSHLARRLAGQFRLSLEEIAEVAGSHEEHPIDPDSVNPTPTANSIGHPSASNLWDACMAKARPDSTTLPNVSMSRPAGMTWSCRKTRRPSCNRSPPR